MVETIKAGERQLIDVFCDKFQFEIPPYQRPYAWTTSEAETLLDDLLEACEGDGQITDFAPYFLGSIVVIKQHDSATAEVIDGQQRLTTLTILFSALRELLEDDARDSADNLIRQKGNFAAGTSDTYRLTARNRDIDFFRTHIQGGKLYDGETLQDSRYNMIENFRRLHGRLKELSAAVRGRLLQFAAQRCFLVLVEASDRESAYRVFSVMNNRGLDLTATDILKAEIVGAIPDDEQDKYNAKWEDIEENLGRDAFGDLFSHIRMIHRKAKMRASLEAEFRQYVNSTQSPKQFIDEELTATSKAFQAILSRTVMSPEYGAEINRLLSGLALLDNYDWQPPAIKFIATHQGDPNFLCGLDRVAYSMFIRRCDINARINRYAAILRAIESGAPLYNEELLGLSDIEKQRTLEALDGPIYEIRKICKQVLLRLDEALSDNSAKYDLPVITIEHVLPQNPDPDSQWMTLFPEEDVRYYWVSRIGNLLLLSGNKNSAASNWDFDTKKTKYFTSSSVSPLAVTTQVLAEPEWSLGVIEKRQRNCLETLADLWGLNS